jgi:hypothetical protein
MMRTVALPVVAGILLGVSAQDARAAGPPCSPVAVEADASIETRWPALPKRVQGAFEAREDVDRCARIFLTSHEGMIDVEVALPDGRTAQRSVSRREDVVPALEALLIVPQAPPTSLESSSPSTSASVAVAAAAPSTPAAAPRPAELPTPTVASVPARESPASTKPAQPSSRLRIELSILTGARVGDGQASVGLGALSFLDLSGWLVGFAGRADRYRMLTGANSGSALELTALSGRRFRFEDMALDLFGGPAAALQGTTTFETQEAATGNSSPPCKTLSGGACLIKGSSSSTVPRLVLGARWSFSARSTVHTFVAIDGDIGPARAGDSIELPGAPRLPIWTVGLALGATVGTP